MSDRELRLEPSVALVVAGKRLTPRQLEVLRAVYEEGSQNKAAQRLGISTPVLHRHIAQIEGKVGAPLTSAGPTGTRLNPEGERIALEHIALSRRMDRGKGTVVGGTVVSEELLLNALTGVDPEGSVDLIISDDQRNLQDFRAGLMDLVVLDDPLYLFELEEVKWQEIVEDRLLHVDKGPRYARFKYGAQRIGFRHLESRNVPYSVERTYRSLNAMADSGLSFFVNESLALRRGMHIRSATEPSILSHQITAVYRKETPTVRKVAGELKRQARVV
ncbi:LysR family transcriptional regulator [Methanomassiliicoccus luminyensis]|uniref:LysR family transcriptional regulator n=1 Tax=Methanomassiliicoccus luminyensis TaxID=1080712 RepID=UPI00037BC555|nr:LysR family transcriptional regulator [Methanomassiliicoccus luminyensis]